MSFSSITSSIFIIGFAFKSIKYITPLLDIAIGDNAPSPTLPSLYLIYYFLVNVFCHAINYLIVCNHNRTPLFY